MKPYYHTWCVQPERDLFPVASAAGDEFVLPDGRRVYDFISTSFQTNFGHSNQAIRKAVHQQLDTMPIASPKAAFALKRDVSERLIERLGLLGGKVFYTVSGAESVENALKMARQVSGRTVILARRKSYHGATLGALSVTGDWRNDSHFTVDAHTVRIPEPEDDADLSATRSTIETTGPDRIAAVIVETVSGTNGVVIPPRSWFDQLQAACREHDLLLIVDEVLCGFGRTGPDFAFQAFELEPDAVCLSKAITGGYLPLGAVWTGPRLVSFYASAAMTCGLTSYAHPLGLAAMGGVLDIMSDTAFQQNKRELEALFSSRLSVLAKAGPVRHVRCCGLLAAVELAGPAPSWETCFAKGLHVYSRGQVLVLAPPMISRPQRLAEAFDILQHLVREEAA